MAVENKFKHSKDLFQNADGSSMVFFMRPCNQRQELRPLIEYGGGKVTSKVLKDSTKLAEKGSMVSGDDYISAHFIEDCVKQNKLLPVDSYRVQPGTRVRSPSGDSDVSKYSFSSNDSMSPAGYIVQTSARDYKGRSKYTKEEDIAMITFLVEERRYSEALGIRVWKDMELRKITKHTASSMNTRYRKHILPNIESYKYDVDRRWLSKLTGGSVVKKTEPEFTADALFATYKKRSKRPDSTARKVNLTGGFGDMFDFTMSDEDNPKKTENVHEIKNINEKKENGDKVVEVGNKSLNKKSKDLKEDQMNSKKGKENQGKEINENQGDNKKGKEIIENKGDIKTGKDNKQNQGDSKKSKEMKGNKGDNQHDGAENSKNKTNSDELIHIGTNFEENNIKKADNEEPSREIATYEEICKDSSNREEQSGGKSNCEKCNQVETDCEKHCKEEVYRAYAVEVVLDKLTEKEINSEKGKFDHSLETLNEKEKLPAESKDKCDGIPGISRKSNDLFEQINKRSKGKDKNKLNSKLDIDNDQEDIEYLNAALPSPSDIFQMTDEDSMELEENDKVDKNEEIKMIVKKMDDGRLTLQRESCDSDPSDNEVELEVPAGLKSGKRKTDEVDFGTCTIKKRLVNSVNKAKENTRVVIVKNSSQVSENAETQEPEVVEISSNEVTSSGQCIIENSGESGGVDILNDSNNDSDSFDEMLRSYIKEKNITVINMADEGNDRDAEVTIVNKRTRQSSKEHNGKQDVRKRRHGTDSTKIVSERDEKKRKLVAECKATIQTITNKYNLSERFVLQLLFQCSNDVNRAVSYIEYGPHSPDLPPWTEADDKALERNPKAAGLIRKFGLADVIGRYNFMNYIT